MSYQPIEYENSVDGDYKSPNSPNPLSRRNSLDMFADNFISSNTFSLDQQWPPNTAPAYSRDNSMTIDEFALKQDSYMELDQPLGNSNFSESVSEEISLEGSQICYCANDICEQKYLRDSKHPRIIEPSSKLVRTGYQKKVQIRIPKELQSYIGYGSCKDCYRALITFITFIQLNCGWAVKNELVQTFATPGHKEYVHARRVIEGFGFPHQFYIETWAPSFQSRFTEACGGTSNIQNAMRTFFVNKPSVFTNKVFTNKPSVKKVSSDKPSYLGRIQKIMEDETINDVRKLHLCNDILYQVISL